jgi:cytochrome c biogenesis protein CcdA
MTLLIISFIAGILTVLAPCILPLLPVIIGSSVGARSKATPYIVIGSLALSILLFTYLLKVSTAFIDIPLVFWSYISGGILAGFGLVLLFPQLWESLPFVSKTSIGANKLMGAGYQKKSIWGDVLIGAALGPVFSSCSPTYFVILGAVLPASFWLGTTYLLAYIAGLVLILVLISLLGQRLTKRLQFVSASGSWFKRGIGILFIVIGLLIITGFDKKFETWVLSTDYLNISIFEQKILDNFVNEPTNETTTPADNALSPITETKKVKIPKHLTRIFSDTDWTKVDPKMENALSGGPSKDGIPAIDDATFVPISSFKHSDSVQAIVIIGETETKVYPYNILTWHEIVNDTIDGIPVAITFCPLCGSAVVYDRTLPNGIVSTFGVSGSLLESNMIMYDRSTENLWQQSTGKTLAGSFYPNKLDLVPFQLLSIAEVRSAYPDAIILSERTGHFRDYSRNPYSGYETDDRFVFDPSNLDTTLPPKTIMAVFTTKDDVPVAAPWLKLREANTADIKINDTTYNLIVTDKGELSIIDSNGGSYPFYFEMWFSFAVQHGDKAQVVTP